MEEEPIYKEALSSDMIVKPPVLTIFHCSGRDFPSVLTGPILSYPYRNGTCDLLIVSALNLVLIV